MGARLRFLDKRSSFFLSVTVVLFILIFVCIIAWFVPLNLAEGFYLMTFGIRSMIVGLVFFYIGFLVRKAEFRYRSARVLAVCLMGYGLAVQIFFVQGILSLNDQSLPGALVGSVAIINFFIFTGFFKFIECLLPLMYY